MSLLVWMPFNKDTENYGLSNITFSGTPQLYENGKIGQCLDLTSPITFTIPEFSNTKIFTIAFWIYCKDGFTTDWKRCLSFDEKSSDGTANGYFRFELTSTYNSICTLFDSGYIFPNTNYARFFTNKRNSWHHICATCDGITLTTYLNGQKKELLNIADGYLTGHTIVGSSDYPGYMNDLRIYDEALSPKMVKTISQGLVCHLPLGNVDGEIGGINIATQTNQGITGWVWNMQVGGTALSEVVEDGIRTCKMVRNSTEASGWHMITYSKIGRSKWKADTNYTVSVDVKSNYTGKLGLNFLQSDGTDKMCNAANPETEYNKKGNWQRIIWKLKTYPTLPSSTSQVFYINTENVSIDAWYQFKNLKIEEGTMATPYTPAPEDNPTFHDGIVYDTSGYKNNGKVTDTCSPTWQSDSPRYRGSYYFNGTNNYISLSQNPIQKTTNEFSISFWFKPSTLDRIMTFYALRTGIGVGIFFVLMNSNYFRLDDNKTTIFNNYKFESVNVWTHVCVTRNSSSKKLYINGQLVDTQNNTGDMDNIGKTGLIGASSSGDYSTANANFVEGKMVDFRIYTTALSDSDILELYQSSASLDSTGKLMLSGEVIE